MVSIVIPTLNEEGVLDNLLGDIDRQTFTDWEVVVADAGSVDATCAIARRHGARVVKGGLPAAGRNAGAAAARGDVLLFLDADVRLTHPDFLRLAVTEYGARTLDIATARIHPMSSRRRDRILHSMYNGYAEAMRPVFAHAPGFFIIIRKQLFDMVGGFDESIRLSEDHDLTNRASKRGRFGILRSVRIHVSTRRFQRDGYVPVMIKYALCGAYILMGGKVRSDVFRYRFGHYKK